MLQRTEVEERQFRRMTGTPVPRLVISLAIPTILSMLISAIYKAGCTRSIVSLPITKDDDYYTFQGILKHAVHFHEKKASVENFAEEGFSLGNYGEKK